MPLNAIKKVISVTVFTAAMAFMLPSAAAQLDGKAGAIEQSKAPAPNLYTATLTSLQTSSFTSGEMLTGFIMPENFNFTLDAELDGRLSAHDFELMGDAIDPNTGSVSFQHVDVSLPGNSNLEVALRRSRRQGELFWNENQMAFGDWTIEIPMISFMYMRSFVGRQYGGPLDPRPAQVEAICPTMPLHTDSIEIPQPPTTTTFPPPLDLHQGDFSEGVNLSIPGQGKKRLLTGTVNADTFNNAQYLTNDHWIVECDNQRGYVASDPQGTRYYFERKVFRTALGYEVGAGVFGAGSHLPMETPNTIPFPREHAIMLVTEVADANGNWVKYQYTNDERAELTRIHSNDGREIVIAYNASPPTGVAGSVNSRTVSGVTVNGRTWDYSYNTTSSGLSFLTRVDLPDGRAWQFGEAGSNLRMPGDNPQFLGPGCNIPDVTTVMRHPDGALGEFRFSNQTHLKGTQNEAPIPEFDLSSLGSNNCISAEAVIEEIPFHQAYSLAEKRISGSFLPTSEWHYSYSGFNGGAVPTTKWTEIAGPEGVTTRYVYGRAGDHDGLLLSTTVLDSASSSVMQTSTTQYVISAPIGNNSLGRNPLSHSRYRNHDIQTKLRLSSSSSTQVDGDSYARSYTYNLSPASPDYSYGQPLTITRTATPTGTARNEVRTYEHNKAKWILGLPKTITRNGKLFDTYTYNANGNVIDYKQFGIRQATVTYHTSGGQAGKIHTYKDALNRTTTLTNYKRGIAQNVTLPENISIARTVDDNGWVTSVTNGRGYTTGYSYTDMGWLTTIDRHSPWADSLFSYSNIGNGLIQTHARGTSRVSVIYDNLFRTIKTKTDDLTGRSETIYAAMSYDSLGREVFSSFPSFSSNPITGVDTTFDALNRAIQTRENVAPFATTTTEYLSNARIRVTDPVGAQSTTSYRRFGSPDQGEVIKIEQPENVTTEMTYDIFGNMLTARQHGTSNGFSVDQTQRYYYDGRLRLCRHYVPETNSTVYAYDDANQMVWRATGRSETSNCPQLTNSSAKIYYSYDDLGRVTGINYPGITPDITNQYDANGNITRIIRGTTDWEYTYTTADHIFRETLNIEGRTYQATHGYNTSGYRTSLTFPDGKKAAFFPDGMGRPTRVQDDFGANRPRWADDIDYHPNGAVYGINYLNGHVLTQTQNARQLLTSIDVRHSAGNGGSNVAVSMDYDHDNNGRITSIDDFVNPLWNRTFTYDDLGRLTGATGVWGSAGGGTPGDADYDYDAPDTTVWAQDLSKLRRHVSV